MVWDNVGQSFADPIPKIAYRNHGKTARILIGECRKSKATFSLFDLLEIVRCVTCEKLDEVIYLIHYFLDEKEMVKDNLFFLRF